MKKSITDRIIFIILEDKVTILRVLFLLVICCNLSTKTIASQEIVSGSKLANLVTKRLKEEGLSAQPAIKKNRLFYGCATDNIIISKRDKSWKTVKLTCEDNKSWNYSFRSKVSTPAEAGKFEIYQDRLEHSATNTIKAVLVLKHSKLKGDRIEKSDLVLLQKKKIISGRAFDDFNAVLGKRLRKSLRKGSILKANHLHPDWLVYKNQRIIIEHNIGEIYVKMEGIALSNGAKGDRISAKNISSNKIIDGFVESAKKISIFRKIY